MSNSTLHLGVTCTQRKTLAVPSELHVHDLGAASEAERATEWCRRVRDFAGMRRSARELYAGDSWAVSQDLEAEARRHGHRVEVWVCSTGYGLIPINGELAPYEATFAPGQSGSIGSLGGVEGWRQCREWWAAVTAGRLIDGDAPTFEALAERGEPIIFAGSESYLRAIGPDLGRAAAQLGERLILISAGTGAGVLDENGLAQHAVPCSARFRAVLHGSMQSLNVRILKMLLGVPDLEWTASAVGKLLAAKEATLPELPTYEDRIPFADDEEARHWIRGQIPTLARPTHSGLLRILRDGGRKCEQKRFRRLFQQVMASMEFESNQHD